MSGWLLALVGVIYFAVMVSFWREYDRDSAIIFLGYTIAQVGFVLKAFRI